MGEDEFFDKNEDEAARWTSEYESKRAVYQDFALRLQRLLTDLLRAERIDVIQIESRAKEVMSFAEKIRRKQEIDESNPLNSITDLVGLRVITYYLDDVDRIGEILQREFEIDHENSMDKSEGLASDQFGYRSAHFVGRLASSRADLLEWQSLSSIPFEVQVRTSLQHAWAAVSHKIEYKAADEAPANLKRRLTRLSALFELADDQFAALRDERTATLSEYKREVSRGQLGEVPIDTSSLSAYWSMSDTKSEFSQFLTDRGLDLVTNETIDLERLETDRSDLVRALRECGLNSLADLESYLSHVVRLEPLVDAMASQEGHGYIGPRISRGSLDDLLTEIIVMDMNRVDGIGSSIYGSRVASLMQKALDAAVENGFSPRNVQS